MIGAGTTGLARATIVWMLKGPIWVYRFTLSSFLGNACRYHPSCSAYALEAIDTHGPMRGTLLALKRIGRCNPWGGSGLDLVPPLKDDKSLSIGRFEI